jgi:hypothetical protein
VNTRVLWACLGALVATVTCCVLFALNPVVHTVTTNTMKITQVQDLQGEKVLWDMCTPKGWVQITTSAPVHIWWTPTNAQSGEPTPLVPGPYLLGPYSPSQTFSPPWEGYPKEKC